MKKTISVLVDYDQETKTYGKTSPDLPAVYAIGDSRADVVRRFERPADEYLRLTRAVPILNHSTSSRVMVARPR